MDHRPDRTLHLRKLFRFSCVFNEPTHLQNIILITVIVTNSLISASQPAPGLISHRSIKSVTELETDLFRNTFFLYQRLESSKMRDLMFD